MKCYVWLFKVGILCALCIALQRTWFLSFFSNHFFLLWLYTKPLDQRQYRQEIKYLNSTLQRKPIKLQHTSKLYHFMQIMSWKLHLACMIVSLPQEFWWAVSWPAGSQLSCPLHIWLVASAKLQYPSGCADLSVYTAWHTKAIGLLQNSYSQTTFITIKNEIVSITSCYESGKVLRMSEEQAII